MEIYQPPTMPNYPTTVDEFLTILKPFYDDEQPLDLFFELYIIDTIGSLPENTKKVILQFCEKHPSFFVDEQNDWKGSLVKQFDLSPTINIAILDLWYRNVAISKKGGWYYHPWHFAKNFKDNYFADGSKVDVWEGTSLVDAKELIDQNQQN